MSTMYGYDVSSMNDPFVVVYEPAANEGLDWVSMVFAGFRTCYFDSCPSSPPILVSWYLVQQGRRRAESFDYGSAKRTDGLVAV